MQQKERKKITFTSRLYNRNLIEKIQKKLNLFGLDKKTDAHNFLNLRIATTFLVYILGLVLELGYIITPLISIIYFVGFEYLIIDNGLKTRASLLEKEATHFFEVLILSLETGRNLEEALHTTCRNVDGKLAAEFEKALKEMKFGRSLSECLSTMRSSIPSETINNVIISITQSNVFGSSAVSTLYTQIDYLREKKIMETKAKISKVPTKISIVSVLFFVPLLLLIILAPVILSSTN